MEWDGSSFTPTPPSPSPRMDVKVSIMHTAHEKFGMKWKGSRRGAYKPHTVSTLADSGCQTSTAGVDLLEEIGCPITYLIPTTHRIMGITKLSLDLIGSVLLRIEYGGVITRQMVHISRNTNGLYLSKTALMDLGLIARNFPLPPASAASIDTLLNEKGGTECEGCEGTQCTLRTAPPERPDEIPFAPTDENIPKLEKWLLDKFASSGFNTCTRQPLPAMTGTPMTIQLKENPSVKPAMAYKPIPVPFHYKKMTKEDLDRDVRLGVIEKVPQGEVNEWCSRMVIIPKTNGKVRRSVDFQNLNDATLREVHHTPSPINLVASIPRGTLKTVVDAWNGYHSLPLDEESSHFTTFITEWGKYRYLRGPQGYHGTGDAYTRRFDDITTNEERYVRCIDDGLLYDNDIENSFWHTFDHIKLCAENGVVFNREKFRFAKETVEFAGFDVTMEGYKPAQRIIQAIAHFPTPKNITDIRSWFGLVNQVAYTFSQSQIMQPFRKLLQGKRQPFYWDKTLDDLFSKSKEEIVRLIGDGVKAYDLNKPTCLATDWSKEGLGFSLTQKHCDCTGHVNPNCGVDHWKLVFAGSKSTNGAQSRYCPIEGECLAAAYGLERCRMYTLGCPQLTLAVDHNPLTRILNNRNLDEITNPRLQRLKEKTLPYKFNIAYVPGGSNAMKTADALSRHPVPSEEQDTEFEEVEKVARAYAATQSEGIESVTWQRVEEACAVDEECISLVQLISEGFPDKGLLPVNLQRYWGMRDELYVIDGVPFKGKKMLIPKSLRPQVLEGLHAANQGVTGMLSNARDRFFWPGLDADVRQMRLQCRQCNEQSPSQSAEPSIVSPPPEVPFEQTAADIFSLEGHTFLAFADAFSGWLEVERLPTNSFRHVRRAFLRWFTIYGVPTEIASDGGPPFNAGEYKTFCRMWDVRRRLSSAYYPQSNGRAEAAVKSAKRILMGNIDKVTGNLDTDAAARAIMMHRNTPTQDTGIAPSVMLFGRLLRDHLPQANRGLREEWDRINDAREKALAKRASRFEEVKGKELPSLNVGDCVQVQNQHGNHPNKWHNTGIIAECLPHRQYHVIMDGSRRITLRNRRFLRKILPISRTSYEANFDINETSSTPTVGTKNTEHQIEIPQTLSTPHNDTKTPSRESGISLDMSNGRTTVPPPTNHSAESEGGVGEPSSPMDIGSATPRRSVTPRGNTPQKPKRAGWQPPTQEVRWSSRERAPRKLFIAKMSGKSHE